MATTWQRLGKRPGPIMYAYGFMRIERSGLRIAEPWRAWDVLRVLEGDVLRVLAVRPMYATTFHRTLAAAKAHCEDVVGERERSHGES